MFTQTVEYALRAAVYLAGQAPRSCTTDEIATATHVPKAYLSKVLQGLGRAGLVHAKRGIGGGVGLGRAPAEVSILEVVNAVEPIKRIRTCPLGLKTHGVNLCPLHRRLDDALMSIENAFGATTLAEVLADPSPVTPLCEFPTPTAGGSREF